MLITVNWQKDCCFISSHYVDNISKFKIISKIRYLFTSIVILPILLYCRFSLHFDGDSFKIFFAVTLGSEALSTLLILLHCKFGFTLGRTDKFESIYGPLDEEVAVSPHSSEKEVAPNTRKQTVALSEAPFPTQSNL
jgi:hypothetical protein